MWQLGSKKENCLPKLTAGAKLGLLFSFCIDNRRVSKLFNFMSKIAFQGNIFKYFEMYIKNLQQREFNGMTQAILYSPYNFSRVKMQLVILVYLFIKIYQLPNFNGLLFQLFNESGSCLRKMNKNETMAMKYHYDNGKAEHVNSFITER